MIGPLIFAIVYFALLIIIVGTVLRKRVKTMQDFAMAGKTLSWPLVTFGLCLVPLGAGHTLSLWEASAGLGAAVVWWSIIVGGVMLPLIMLWFGPWVRELGVETFPEVMERLFGSNMRYLHASVSVGSWTGIAAAETLASAAAIYGLSGGSIPFFPWCIIIAFAVIVCYIVFGGILQYAWISVINACVMILGSYLALFFLGDWLLANIGGWQPIANHYIEIGEAWKLEILRLDPALIYQIIIPVAVLHISAACVAQGLYQPLLSARSDEDCRKGIFLGAFINGISSFPWVVMALVGMAIPAIAAVGPKLVDIELAMQTLPTPVIGLLMVCLLSATLSTGSAVILGHSSVIVNDIIKSAIKPDLSDQARLKLMRWMIVVCTLLAFIPAMTVPIVFPVFLWAFSFGIPVFVMFVLGMIWKASRSAAWITILFTYLVNFIWTFWTPGWATGPWGLNMYPVTVCSIVLGVVLTGILPGKGGLLKRHRAGLA